MFIQILNVPAMRSEFPCVRGPRVSTIEGREYVSVRHFQFFDDHATVTNITIWRDAGWHKRSHSGRLYAVTLDELGTFCQNSHLRVDDIWGSYAREPFDVQRSNDLLVTATRV